MKVKVERFLSNKKATLSKIFVDEVFWFYGLEDEYRTVKVPGETRIPAGIYNLKVRTNCGMNQKYAARFRDAHKGMIEVANVPGFTDIFIHIGNTEHDTAGCLLVGLHYTNRNGELTVTQSVGGYTGLYSKIINAVQNGTCTIEYVDHDR